MLQHGIFLFVSSDEDLAYEVVRVIQRHGVPRHARTLAEALRKLAPGSARWTGVVVDLEAVGSDPAATLASLREIAPQVPLFALATVITPDLVNRAHALRVELVVRPLERLNLTSFVRRALVSDWLPDERVAAWVGELARRRALTSREVQLMAYALGDESREGVMGRLGISENTLKTQVRGLLRKCGARSLDGLAKNVLRDALFFRAAAVERSLRRQPTRHLELQGTHGVVELAQRDHH